MAEEKAAREERTERRERAPRNRGRRGRRRVCSFCVDKMDYRTWQNLASPDFWQLCKTSTDVDRSSEKGTCGCIAAIYCRII